MINDNKILFNVIYKPNFFYINHVQINIYTLLDINYNNNELKI